MAWLTLVVVLVALTGVSSTAQQGQSQGRARMLFEARGDAADAAPGQADRTKKRGRRVRVNAAALQQADAPGGADIVTLNLFDDVQLRARRNQLEATSSGGWVWKGRLLDVEGQATFAIQDGIISGTVFAGDKVFEVLYAGGDEHEVREIEPSAFPTDDPQADLAQVDADPQAEAMDAAVAAEMAGDAASQVDVMVIWTPAARTAAGGVSAIQSLVNLAVANTNTGYANSAATQRLRLVYAGELSHTESSPTTDLSRLAMTTDGYLDSVHTLRNTYGADVVTLLGEGYVNAGACGVGYLMTYVSTGFASSAFNVVDRTCAAGNLSYAHELGHNMGLQHDPNNANSSGAYSYAYGYQQPAGAFRTVMAYGCPTGSCPRLMYFSNPSVSYNGMATGTASQNNALALNNTAPSVANFRQAVSGSCSYSLGSTSASVGSGTATSSVAVTAGSGCAWTAASNASWLTITGGASGAGNGTTSFSVAANTAGTARSGTLTVAGLTFTVNQAAAACGAFTISPTSQSDVLASGASLSVTVTGTTGCARTATSNASWITVTAGATGTGSGTVSLSVAANTVGISRTGTVTVAGQVVTVTQAAANCSYSLSSASTSVGAAGASGQVGVTATSGCNWTASANVGWIAVTSGASGTGTGTVGYTVAANAAGLARSGTLTVAGKTFTLSQAAAACTYGVTPLTQSFGNNAGTGSVSIVAPTGCAWNVTKDATWVTVSGSTSGSGNGSLAFGVAANTSGKTRTGRLFVQGATVTVSQNGKSRKQALDFDLDGAGDLLLHNASSGAWRWEISVADGFQLGSSGSWGSGWQILPADFDADDRSDLFLYNGSTGDWRRLITQPDGTYSVTNGRWATGWSITVVDLTGDRRSDLFLYNSQTGQWFQCLTQDGADPFSYRNGAWARGWTVTRGVFNADGRDDLFLYNGRSSAVDSNSGRWFRVVTQADLSFAYLEGEQRWIAGWTVVPADFTGDGTSEVLLTRADGLWFMALFSATGTTYRSGTWAAGFTAQRAEFNGDGRADVFLYNPTTGQWATGVTQIDGTFAFSSGTWLSGWQSAVTDLNGDGISDVALYHPQQGLWAKVVTTSPGVFAYTIGSVGSGWTMIGGHVVLP